MLLQRAFFLLKRLNEIVAVLAGSLLLVSVMVTITDIVSRQLGRSLGGTDELSGYAMAIATSWGMAYTLTSLAHVRIDILRSRVQTSYRAIFDLIALLCLSSTACIVAYRVWPVLEKSINNHSTANTTLETPLWIPQGLWMAGWAWFAMASVIMSLYVLSLLVSRQFKTLTEQAGVSEDA